MIESTVAAVPSLDRRGLIARLTAVTLTVAMANVLSAKGANAACDPGAGCYGYDGCYCHGGGCTPSPSGLCCWAYVDNQACKVYYCCDETCTDQTTGICRYLVCNCC